MAKMVRRVRIAAITVGAAQIVWSVIARIWSTYQSYHTLLYAGYSDWPNVILSNISGILSSASSGLLLILLALLLDPHKVVALQSKQEEESSKTEAKPDEGAQDGNATGAMTK